MTEQDRQDCIDRYTARLQRHGVCPQALGWGVDGRQGIRFSVLSRLARNSVESSVLDVGCGFADLFFYLREQGWKGKYFGIDIVGDFLDIARARDSKLDLHNQDLLSGISGKYDFVIASGIFNSKLRSGTNEKYIAACIEEMFRASKVAVSVDFLSAYCDIKKEELWYTDPAFALSLARQLTRRVELRMDYMPFEFSMTLYRDDTVSERRIFSAFESSL